MNTHEKAPDADQGAEGTVPTQQGRDMSDITPTPTITQEDTLLRAWASAYAASRAVAATAAVVDVRTYMLAYPDRSEEQATDWALAQAGWQHPPVPRDLWPSWAVDVEVIEGGAREVHIVFAGTTHGDVANLERFYTVVIRGRQYADLGDDLGTWECEGTKVWSNVLSEDLAPDAARTLAAALTAAVDELEARA